MMTGLRDPILIPDTRDGDQPLQVQAGVDKSRRMSKASRQKAINVSRSGVCLRKSVEVSTTPVHSCWCQRAGAAMAGRVLTLG